MTQPPDPARRLLAKAGAPDVVPAPKKPKEPPPPPTLHWIIVRYFCTTPGGDATTTPSDVKGVYGPFQSRKLADSALHMLCVRHSVYSARLVLDDPDATR